MYGDFLRGLCYNIKAAFFVVCSVLYSYFCFGGLFVELKVNCGIWGTMFGVPHIVADNFLKLATGDQLKVLIYCLRCSGKSCSTEEISRNTGVSVNDVADSIMFWQQANVLTTNDSVPDSTVHQTIFNAADQTQNCESNNESPSVRQRQKQTFQPSEISEILNSSKDISELFKVAESALGTLGHTMQNSLIWIHEYLGLKKEVIITLLFYCLKIGKTNSSYIEKIACSWSENEINTLSAAEEEVNRLTLMSDYVGKVMKAFEMNRRPTTKQTEFIEKWREAGFGTELLRYAYEKTVEQIDKLSFDYINKILLSWRESGFTSVKDVNDAENNYKHKKNSSKNNDSNDPDIEKYNIVINKLDLA